MFRLIACDRKGAPVEPLRALPPELHENCVATGAFLASVGFEPPWIGYVCVSDDTPVGCCAFVGPPKDGAVEISYFTLPAFEGRGFASQAAAHMVAIARRAGGVAITAKTMPEENASTKILRRNGFAHVGETEDHEIGVAWLWRLPD